MSLIAFHSFARRQLFSHLRSSSCIGNSYKFYSSEAPLDVLVVGGGPGGYVAAIKAAQLGLNTACIEGRGALGGTCLNVGCIPSKALLHSSHMYWEAQKHFAGHGVVVGDVKIDVDKMMEQKSNAVTGLTKGIEGLFKKNKVEYIPGWGKFKSATEVDVDLAAGGSRTVSAKNIIIATGSDVAALPGITIDEERIVSSTGALKLKKVPESMIVIGGGYIGLEMGSVWGRLGSKITVVEFAPNIVPTMDGDIRKQFQRSLQKQGFTFMLNTKVTSAQITGDKVKLTVEPSKGGDAKELEAEIVLVSAGRRPYTDNLNLEAVGITPNKRGQIEVDDHFRTNVPNVYAIGDVIPGPMLAHKAEEDGVAAVEIIAGKQGLHTRIILATLFRVLSIDSARQRQIRSATWVTTSHTKKQSNAEHHWTSLPCML
eukprot:TRINITY_DN1696_c0_g1_i3.p1 TRINITY_DN1696_c0_g1~~TRINITY_DN1696_c0_g1_i3.p1  ORF type:complete len:498 (-),score=43.94 TRINITY_DN1696_c0_g1_i3:3886-5166(-)